MKRFTTLTIIIYVLAFLAIGCNGSDPASNPVRETADAPSQIIAIHGDIVSENGAEPGWVVFDRTDGYIIDICDNQDEIPEDAQKIIHDGYIFPALLDCHDHTHWNSIPMWRPGQYFENRYEWQETEEYQNGASAMYGSINDAGLWWDSLTYGEIRAMIGGVSLLQGSDGATFGYLVRNLNQNWGVVSVVDDVTTGTPEEIGELLWYLEMGYIGRIFFHVAEGKSSDPRSQAEFQFMEDNGLTVPGVVVIHGVALTPEDFQVMAENGMYLVWSPKSNLVLYGETADVLSALNAGVKVALGADWSITGSDNLLEELKVAYKYSVDELDGTITPKMLYKMVTTDAADVAWVNDPYFEMLGYIDEGYQADLFLTPRYDDDPHVSLLKTYSRDIQLMFIDGVPVYGDRHYMDDLVPADELDEITVSNKTKAIDIIDPEFGPYYLDHFSDLVGHFDVLDWDIAALVEDDPGQQPGFPRNLP